MYAVCVSFRIKDGFEGAFHKRMAQQANDSLTLEADCHHFDICHNQADPREVFLYELYTNEAAFALHNESAHFISFAAEVADWIEQKTVTTYDLVRTAAAA